MKIIRTAVLGMGSVHQNLLTILDSKQEELAESYGVLFQIVAATDSSGIVVATNKTNNGGGLDMRELVALKQSGGRLSELKEAFRGAGRETVQQVLKNLRLDLLFEATPCCVGDPTKQQQDDSSKSHSNSVERSEALDIIRSALMSGVSVVLANKGPLVQAIGELRELAQPINENGRLAYSATVCGGLPILNIGTRDMIAGRITKVQGVFNATSNFVLDALALASSDGGDGGTTNTWEDAIAEAQRVGAAEADPTLDTDGWDTAFKLLIIVNTIMMKRSSTSTSTIQLKDISVQGIQDITPDRIAEEAEQGNVIKLVATADEQQGQYSVTPRAVPKDSFLGSITGWEMGVELHSDIYGISYHKLYEKEPIPTAASMMRDAVNMFRHSSSR